MPIYEYQCRGCGHQDTEMDSISAPRVKKCPSCGKRTFERLISASAFHLKGGGWYETDFKNKPKPGAGEGKGGKDGKDGKSAEEGVKGDSGEVSKSGESDGKSSGKAGESGKGDKTDKAGKGKKSSKSEKDSRASA